MSAHHFVIDPAGGVGPIRFGMHKDDVARAFPYVYRSFFKTPESKVRADQIEVVGLVIHYDDDARVDHIEISPAQYGTVTLELFGQDITGITVRRAFELLSQQSSVYVKDAYGYDFPELGISLYNHDLESEEERVECIGVSQVR